MIQADKDLLLRDLCARLPYGIKVEIYKDEPPYKIKGYDGKDFLSDSGWDYLIEQCKPYLFPLSSMTEEQNLEYLRTCKGGNVNVPTLASFDWLNKNHFDYRGLIEKGLAIDATWLDIY